MADTSNLTNFLGDIADAIRTKKETTEQIPAGQFDQEILSIETGIDTSDATAIADDIIHPKTAYAKDGKITGNMQLSQRENSLGHNYTKSSNVITKTNYRHATKIMPDGNVLAIVGSNINVYDKVGNLLNTYAVSTFGTHSNHLSIDACGIPNDNGAYLVIIMSSTYDTRGDKCYYSVTYYKDNKLHAKVYDTQTVTYTNSNCKADYGFAGMVACKTTNNQFYISSRGTGLLKIAIDENLNMTKSSLSITNYDDVRVIRLSISDDDNYLYVNMDKPWDGGQSGIIYLPSATEFHKNKYQSDIIPITVNGKNYCIAGDKLYSLNITSMLLIKSSFTGVYNSAIGNNANPTGYRYGVANDKYLIISNVTTNAKIYNINDISKGDISFVEDITTVTGAYICAYRTNDYMGVGTSSQQGYLITTHSAELEDDYIIHAGYTLHNTSNANVAANDIVEGKIAYGSEGKIEGTLIPLDTSDATATANDIFINKSAYIANGKVIGSYTTPLYLSKSQLPEANANEAIRVEPVITLADSSNRMFTVTSGNITYTFPEIPMVLSSNQEVVLVYSKSINKFTAYVYNSDKLQIINEWSRWYELGFIKSSTLEEGDILVYNIEVNGSEWSLNDTYSASAIAYYNNKGEGGYENNSYFWDIGSDTSSGNKVSVNKDSDLVITSNSYSTCVGNTLDIMYNTAIHRASNLTKNKISQVIPETDKTFSDIMNDGTYSNIDIYYTNLSEWSKVATSSIDATCTSADILDGKTAYANNHKLTGTIPNNGELNYTPSIEEQTIPAGYTSGGVIAPMDITTSEDYKMCEAMVDNILGDTKPYIKIEYIRSTGTQWIDTGYVPNDNTKYEITLSDVDGSRESTIFGTGAYAGNQDLLVVQGREIRWYYYTNYLAVTSDFIPKNLITLYRGTITCNGNTISSQTGENASTNTSNLYIYKCTGNTLYASYKLYSFKVYENDTLVRNFIPVKDLSGTACLYDLVESKFYYNGGSGNFISGGVI